MLKGIVLLSKSLLMDLGGDPTGGFSSSPLFFGCDMVVLSKLVQFVQSPVK